MRDRALLAICVLVWCAGTGLAAHGGLWIGAGGAALLLGTLVAIGVPEVRRALLPRRWADVAVGVAAGLAMAAATHALYALLRAWLGDGVRELYATFASLSGPAAAIALVPIIVGEELVWRGLCQRVVTSWCGRWGGVLVATLIYAAVHAPLGQPVLVLAAFGCGLMWSGLAAWRGGLAAPLAAHLVWDFAVLLFWPVDLR